MFALAQCKWTLTHTDSMFVTYISISRLIRNGYQYRMVWRSLGLYDRHWLRTNGFPSKWLPCSMFTGWGLVEQTVGLNEGHSATRDDGIGHGLRGETARPVAVRLPCTGMGFVHLHQKLTILLFEKIIKITLQCFTFACWHVISKTSLINKSGDWPPNYHKTARMFPQICWAPQINE